MATRDRGDWPIEAVDDANIPVDIRIHPPNENNNKWRLTASNYMPRRAAIAEDSLKVEADSREELVDLLRKHIIPLYEVALRQLNKVADGTAESLYYWLEEAT